MAKFHMPCSRQKPGTVSHTSSSARRGSRASVKLDSFRSSTYRRALLKMDNLLGKSAFHLLGCRHDKTYRHHRTFVRPPDRHRSRVEQQKRASPLGLPLFLRRSHANQRPPLKDGTHAVLRVLAAGA